MFGNKQEGQPNSSLFSGVGGNSLFKTNTPSTTPGIFGIKGGTTTTNLFNKNDKTKTGNMFNTDTSKSINQPSVFGNSGSNNNSSMFGNKDKKGIFSGNLNKDSGKGLFQTSNQKDNKASMFSGNTQTKADDKKPGPSMGFGNSGGGMLNFNSNNTTNVLNAKKPQDQNPSKPLFGLNKPKTENVLNPSKSVNPSGGLFNTTKPLDKAPKVEKSFTFGGDKALNFGSNLVNQTKTDVDTKKKLSTFQTDNVGTKKSKELFSQTKTSNNLFNNQKTKNSTMSITNPLANLQSNPLKPTDTKSQSKPNVFSSKENSLFEPKLLQNKPKDTNVNKPLFSGTAKPNPLGSLGQAKSNESGSKPTFNFGNNLNNKPKEGGTGALFSGSTVKTKTESQNTTNLTTGLFSSNSGQPKNNLLNQGKSDTTKPLVTGKGGSSLFNTNTANPTNPANPANPTGLKIGGITNNLTGNNANTQKNEPSMETIKREKFYNKRVLEVQTNWEKDTNETKNNIKKLGILLNSNEDQLRKIMNNMSELKAAKETIELEHKGLESNLDKIISDQKNIEMQFDIMERELDNVLNQNDYYGINESGDEDLFAQANVINKKLSMYERNKEQFTQEINGASIDGNLDIEFNKALNNFFESLGVIEGQIDHIDKRLIGSFGVRQYTY
jgi:hypothetical protein